MTAALKQISSPMELAQKRRAALWGDDGILGKLERSKVNIAARLPEGVNVDRWLAALHTEISRTPNLKKCDPLTVIGGAYEIAQMGLHMGSVLGQAYLVPFRMKGKYVAQLIIGYKGMIALAQEAGIISSVHAACVYERDAWRYRGGLEPILEHEPCGLPPGEGDGQRGKRMLAYAILRHSAGGATHCRVEGWELDALKAKQTARSKSTPWTTHTERMEEKTAIRRSMRLVRLSPMALRGVTHDELADAGIDQGLRESADEAFGDLALDAEWSETEVHTNDCHPDAEPPEDA